MDAISNYVNMLEITLLVILFSADLSHMDYLCATACCRAAAPPPQPTPEKLLHNTKTSFTHFHLPL
jgi:hypothetical protein